MHKKFGKDPVWFRRAIFTKSLCMLPVSVAQSSSDIFTIGRIAYCWEGVFFPLNMYYWPGKGIGVHSAGGVCYLRLPCCAAQLMGHMLVVAERIVKELGVAETNEYRVVINNERRRQQAVYHPQIHVMAGRKMSWPPG